MPSTATTYTVRFPDGSTYGPAELPLLQQWAQEGRLSRDAVLVPGDGSPECPVATMEALRPHVMAPPTVFTGLPVRQPDDSAVATLIPYRNAPALVGYYTSVASLIPIFGLLLGPLAVTLGIAGYRKSLRNQHAKGAVHAWVAIIVGSLATLANIGFFVLVFRIV
jgi:hypothetical protein